MDAALRLLRETVTHRWESVDQILREHGHKPLGDPLTPGTAAWHLRHIVEIFRTHALAASRQSLRFDAPLPADPAGLRLTLLRDLDRFIDWVDQQPLDRLSGPASLIDYGGPQSLETMLGIMSRHITWHAAAVHYWCKWKL